MTPIESLHEEIRRCRACQLVGYMIEPPPLVWGLAPAPFMLIGQAPGKTDLGERRMYRGPAAQRLFSWLRSTGFSDDDFGTTIYMTALTKCFPGRLPGKSTDRAPSNDEIARCRPWLDRQIELVQPNVVILFGKMSIDRFLGKSPLTERIGKTFTQDERLYIPLPHSSGASVWLNDPRNKALLEEALDHIRIAKAAYASGLPQVDRYS